MLNVSQGVKEILVGAGQQIWTTRNEFLYEWNAALDHITFDESILSVDKIGRLDLVGFDKTKKRLEGNIQRLRYLIVKLKTDLTFIKENGSDRFNTITQTATLRLKRASVSFIKDPILRALIAKYSEKKNWFYKELKYWTEKLTTLWIIMRRKAWTTIFKAESSWSEKRYFCVYPQFEEAVRSCILVNTDEIYRRYQQKFDSFTSYSTEKVMK